MADMRQVNEGFWTNEDGSLIISKEGDRYYVFDGQGERANLSTLEKALRLAESA